MNPAVLTYSKQAVDAHVIGSNFLENLESAVAKLGRKAIYIFVLIVVLQLILAASLGVISV